jgi:hypothetical protein
VDFGDAAWGIGRDIDELRSTGAFGWIVLTLTFGLPVASFVVLVARNLLALIPLCISAGLFALWALYYATDWFSNPGQGAWAAAMLGVVIGWLVLAIALLSRWRPDRPLR